MALLVPLTATTRAGIILADYERWQAYNGWRIKVIEFPGIKSFARADLLTVMATEKPTWLRRYVALGHRPLFYADDFAADLIRLERFYAREGFPHARVHGIVTADHKRQELRLKLEITEGPPVTLESWRLIMGSDSGAGVDSSRWSELMPLKLGERLAISAVRIAADTLRYKLREIGHARARVEFEISTDSARNRAQVNFILFPGHFCRFGQTRFTGLKQVGEQTARRELTYHELDPYSPAKLEATRKRLVRLETFNFVNVQADTSTPGDTLTVWVRTEEGQRYRLRLGGGYETVERWRAQTEFTDLNFFGRARRFTIGGSLSEFKRRLETRLFWPHTPWNATDITLNPKWEFVVDPGFTLETRSATTILSATPLDRVAISLSNEFGSVGRHDRVSLTDSRYLKSVETISIGWDTRDNPLVGRKGHFLGATFAESGAFYRTELRWWRALVQSRVLVPRGRFTVLAGKAELGVMGPLHDSRLTPIEERFKLGGPTTVRGWDLRRPISPRENETPVGGDVAFHVTAEVRRNVWGPVTLTLFSDAGNVWTDASSTKPLDLLPSAGLGLLFLTPLGPIRADWAEQLRANPYGFRKNWAFHLTLGTPF